MYSELPRSQHFEGGAGILEQKIRTVEMIYEFEKVIS